MDGGTPAATAPAPPDSLYARLGVLRYSCVRGINHLAWLSLIILIPLSMAFMHSFGAIGMVVVMEVFDVDGVAGVLFYIISLLVVGVALALGLMLLVRMSNRRMYARWHGEVWRELHSTNLALLVVDEAYTSLLVDRINDTFGLAWFSPAAPKGIEQQLEFAACYHVALRKLLWGVSRLENSPLWQGGFTWYAGTSRGVTCGCFSLWLLSVFGFGLWIMGAMLYLKRCAVLAAYCDFLLKDD